MPNTDDRNFLVLAKPNVIIVELRNHSWAVDPVFDLLSRYQET